MHKIHSQSQPCHQGRFALYRTYNENDVTCKNCRRILTTRKNRHKQMTRRTKKIAGFMSNKELLAETLYAQIGDGYDGDMTEEGDIVCNIFVACLEKRLGDWLNG